MTSPEGRAAVLTKATTEGCWWHRPVAGSTLSSWEGHFWRGSWGHITESTTGVLSGSVWKTPNHTTCGGAPTSWNALVVRNIFFFILNQKILPWQVPNTYTHFDYQSKKNSVTLELSEESSGISFKIFSELNTPSFFSCLFCVYVFLPLTIHLLPPT